MSDYTPQELAEIISAYRYQLKQERDRVAALESTMAKLYARIAELEKNNA